jgi:molecular chaperone DnaK (HSP70)
MVDTGKEAAVQELRSTGVQPSSYFSPKASKIQQPKWQQVISTASAITSGPSPCTEAASDDYNLEPSISGSTSDEGASDHEPGQSTKGLHFEYVIALDFGTTFSAVAFSRISRRYDDDIRVMSDWPRRRDEKPCVKTLTGLYYKRTELGHLECASWGYSARAEYMYHRHSGQGIYLTKFKLLLKKDLNDPDLARSIPAPLTATGIITDYLRLIGEHALSVVRNHVGDAVFSKDSVQWCVTVPSIWDENAKQQMKACMVNAGLVAGTEAVKVVLEPEAASFHCHQILREERKDVSLNTKDKILVADVGGGTVDIVVQELVGNSQNYQVKELTESSGGLCGGTFIDESFLRYFSKRIPCLDEFLKDYPSYRTQLLKDWEEIKCAFGHEMMSDGDTKDIVLHNKLAAKWEAYETERGNEVEVTEQDLKSIFDPVVDEILELIAAQLTQVPDIKVMFVVGGFAGSPYLMRRIRARFSSEVAHIVSPPAPGSAIVQGAVSLALLPGAIVSRISKKTYGTSVILPFDHALDLKPLLKVTNGVEYCRNRFDVFVKKGEGVEVNDCLTKNNAPRGPFRPRSFSNPDPPRGSL